MADHCDKCDCSEKWECYDTCHINCSCCLHALPVKFYYKIGPFLILGAFAVFGFYQLMHLLSWWIK